MMQGWRLEIAGECFRNLELGLLGCQRFSSFDLVFFINVKSSIYP